MSSTHVALVTGAAGSIGRRLCQRLFDDGWRVYALVRANAGSGPWHQAVVADISDENAVRSTRVALPHNPNVVFHLAGRAHVHDERADVGGAFQRVNVLGTDNVVTLAQILEARRFVLVSSVAAMGDGGDIVRDETHPCEPRSEYGRSRLQAERVVTSRLGRDAVIVRFPMVYGDADRGNMTRMVEAIARRRFPPLPEIRNRRSLLHIDNALDALCLVAEHPRAGGETYIVTDAEQYSTSQIYETARQALGRAPGRFTVPLAALRAAARIGDVLGAITGRRLPLDSQALSKLTDSAAYSSAKISSELGFRARRSLSSGLRDVVGALRR